MKPALRFPHVAEGFVDIGGPAYRVDFGGQGPLMVLVHGLGGSHANWLAAAPLLARFGRVVAVDLPGFGRTPPAGRSASVVANADFVATFIGWLGEPAVVVGNSMGGLVALALAARHPERVAGLVLVNPVLPRVLGAPVDREIALSFASLFVPGLGELALRRHYARLGPEGVVAEVLTRCGLDLPAIDPAVYEAHCSLMRERFTYPWQLSALLQAARSVVGYALQPAKYAALIARVGSEQAQVPTLLLHGTRDRLVSCELARAMARSRPEWTYAELEGAGHVPQIEVPERFASEVEALVRRLGPRATS